MIILFSIVALFSLSHDTQAAEDPEAYMTATELIRHWGYPAEFHDVITADGYILGLFRIPHGRYSEANSTCRRPAVLFVHGFGGGPTEFILNPPESAPAFLLADAGFDVFLLGHRGTTYSKRHKTLKPWDNKFWHYSVDELSKYDATAVIDKVLEISGESGTYWVGHSQGTTMGWLTLADHPDYNKKVKALFQLAPSGTCGYGKGVIQLGYWAYNNLKPIADFYRVVFGSHEISFQLAFIYRPLVRLCNIIPGGQQICNSATHYLMGPSTRMLNFTRAPTYLSHIPSGVSTMNALHLAQETPPPYNLTNIDVPVYLFTSKTDWLATPEDVALLKTWLREGVVKETFEIEGYNHIDFAVAEDCGEKVFQPITKIVRSQEKDMCTQ